MAPDPSLRLRPWASLLLFVSAYSPLLLILVIKDYDPAKFSLFPRHPLLCAALLIVAIVSCLAVLSAVGDIKSGLTVQVARAANKSGEMFGYSIPYVLSFLRIDLGDWQTLASLLVFLGMSFVIAYRTQTVFVNPVLALAGYILIECSFKRGNSETQAMVISRVPLKIGDLCSLERLSHYLYVVVEQEALEQRQEQQ